jgi:hypothetical protein
MEVTRHGQIVGFYIPVPWRPESQSTGVSTIGPSSGPECRGPRSREAIKVRRSEGDLGQCSAQIVQRELGIFTEHRRLTACRAGDTVADSE